MSTTSKNINMYHAATKTYENAVLYDNVHDIDDIGASRVNTTTQSKYILAGSADLQANHKVYNFTKYGKLTRAKEVKTHGLLHVCDYITSHQKTSSIISRMYGGSAGWQGMLIACGPFILTEAKKAQVHTKAYTRLQASTSPDWCFSGFGWKFTNVKFLGGHTPEFQYILRTGDNGGRFEVGAGGHPWLSSENLPSNANCRNNYAGALFHSHTITGSNDIKNIYDETSILTIPKGKTYLCMYWSSAASGGDSAGFEYYAGEIDVVLI